MAVMKSDATTTKLYTYGTHRACDPAETFARIAAHFPWAGITRIADITGLDTIGIPVCVGVRPNAKSLSVSQGKGMTLMAAKVSAAMESLEAHHAENITLPQLKGGYNTLKADYPVCNPQHLCLQDPALYDDDLVLAWVEGTNLVNDAPVWVPYDLVHCNFLADYVKHGPFLITSNGLASGNTLLEATSHAICEVIERDAIYLWKLLTTNPNFKVQALNLETVNSPLGQTLLTKLDAAGLETYVWSLTSDIGLPVFGCVIFEARETMSLLPLGVYQGFGCHLSAEVAFIRAVTEAVQSRLTYISGARDDIFRAGYTLVQSGVQHTVWRHLFDPALATLDFAGIPSLETNRLDEDVATQLKRLQKMGFQQVIRVDLSQPHVGLPVVRVIIPHLGQWFGGPPKALTQRAKSYLLQQLMVQKLLRGDF